MGGWKAPECQIIYTFIYFSMVQLLHRIYKYIILKPLLVFISILWLWNVSMNLQLLWSVALFIWRYIFTHYRNTKYSLLSRQNLSKIQLSDVLFDINETFSHPEFKNVKYRCTDYTNVSESAYYTYKSDLALGNILLCAEIFLAPSHQLKMRSVITIDGNLGIP